MMNIRIAVSIACAVLLGGCKIELESSIGGQIRTVSGNHICTQGAVCEIDVSDTNFEETFIAVPFRNDGYRFVGWKNKPKAFFGGKQDLRVTLSTKNGFKGNDSLMALLNNDEKFYLEAVFKKDEGYELIEGGKDTQTVFDESTGEAYAGDPPIVFRDANGRLNIFQQYKSFECNSGGVVRCNELPIAKIFAYSVSEEAIKDVTSELLVDIRDFDRLPAHSDSAVADFNGDGAEDIAFSNMTEGYTDAEEGWRAVNHILISIGDKYELKELDPYEAYSGAMTAGDIDLDGDIDIFVSEAGRPDDPDPRSLGLRFVGGYVLENDGNGNFKRQEKRFAGGHGHLLVDLDNDGVLELVAGITDWKDGVEFGNDLYFDVDYEFGLRVYKLNASGVYEIHSMNINPLTSDPYLVKHKDKNWDLNFDYDGSAFNLNYFNDIAAIDVNADGRKDLVVQTATDSGEFTSILMNQGNLRFRLNTNRIKFYHPDEGARFLRALDADEDGYEDIVWVNVDGLHNIADVIYYNTGTGNFSNDGRERFPSMTGVLAPGDFDRDGDLDFFVTHSYDHKFGDRKRISTVELLLNKRID
ncbi:FG-GAP repeat domain-containing protein [Parahaliea mediterranea]|uniref:FG-GAP repeat domain-containing protein n=1 Tax=Parahaliea mediterranea TaxID=651086 RepID=UPI000E2F9175|nr:VCBS repeat-containing protein [Parahaliea mediterranea]